MQKNKFSSLAKAKEFFQEKRSLATRLGIKPNIDKENEISFQLIRKLKTNVSTFTLKVEYSAFYNAEKDLFREGTGIFIFNKGIFKRFLYIDRDKFVPIIKYWDEIKVGHYQQDDVLVMSEMIYKTSEKYREFYESGKGQELENFALKRAKEILL